MALDQQGFLDGVKTWGGQLINAAGQGIADNIAPEKNTGQAQEMESGPPTPNQQAAAALPFQLGEAKKLMMFGGLGLAAVTVVVMMGARR